MLTPPKILLLCVHMTAHGDVEGMRNLSSRYTDILRKDIILRILLTYLPETTGPQAYVNFLREISLGQVITLSDDIFDVPSISALSEQEARRKANKLHLAQLSCYDIPTQHDDDLFSQFLIHRACRMDSETGMLFHVPKLVVPFLHHSLSLRTWIASTVLPFVRRNTEYYAEPTPAYSLAQFQKIPGSDATLFLLTRSGSKYYTYANLGRDLRGLIGPWLYDDTHWQDAAERQTAGCDTCLSSTATCPGWEQVLDWITSHAILSRGVTIDAVQEWGGPTDVDFGHEVTLAISEYRQRYLDRTYARALLASAYVNPETTLDSLSVSYRLCAKARSLLDDDQSDLPLQDALFSLPDLSVINVPILCGAKALSPLRNELLKSWNPPTSTSRYSTKLLMALVLSALILSRLGVPCTVKRAGDLAFLQDGREQKGELDKVFHTISRHPRQDDDDFWIRARREVLWLHDWGRRDEASIPNLAGGVFGAISREYIEAELLKALLSKSRYPLARRLFDDGPQTPLAATVVRDVVFQSALSAFDNATDTDQKRGGLKKCDEIIHAFPTTVCHSLPGSKQIQALLDAMHVLGRYRLIHTKGEPFSPVVLRVHSDPISIIDQILQQNPQAYTRLQEFLEMGSNIIRAGLPSCDKSDFAQPVLCSSQDRHLFVAKRRIIAMCIEAALREHDFETAYSYVVSRLGTSGPGTVDNRYDRWSWHAAVKAGQYVRTELSQQPTHLGTASGNLEIRHHEQRLDCLAAALLVAPISELPEILKSFRRCEEQLDSAIKEEAASEAAWDATVDLSGVPGTFDHKTSGVIYPREVTAGATTRQAEEAPMSLFDLSRATAKIAQRNIPKLSRLQNIVVGKPTLSRPPELEQRIRKRDQLRDVAKGTLVSGVGWLIGANVSQSRTESS